MTLTDIAEATDLPTRQLRYVIDHELIPGLRLEQQGRGNARRFPLFDAVVITVAASLLHAGVNATRVHAIMEQGRGAKRSRYQHSFKRAYDVGELTMNFRTNTMTVTAVNLEWIIKLLKGEIDD